VGTIHYVRDVAHFVATERLLLRPVRPDDLPVVFVIQTDPHESV
jgi:hypothetical protein